MANPPPPYSDITGISRTVMKDNAQETLVNYNGNARPGEIVADLTTDPPALYVGNNAGELTAITSGSSSTGNITFTGNVISTTGTNNLLITLTGENFIANTAGGGAIGLYSGNSQIAINNDTPGIEITSLNVNLVARAEGDIFLDATAANGVVDINSAGNTTITANGNVWNFDTNGTLTAPGNIGLPGRVTCQVVVTDPVNLDSLTPVFGARAFILDGNLAAAGNFGAQVSGSGGNSVPVWSDGTNWYIG
jgi:hypothetical protein